MSDPFITLARARLAATGSSLDLDLPNLVPTCNVDAEFDRVVRDYYTFFNEAFSREIAFLVQLRPSQQLDALRRLIYNLRTATSHTDNPRAEQAAARWRNQYNSPQDAANALAAELTQGIELLGRIAVALRTRE